MELTKEFKQALINVDKLPFTGMRKQIETCRLIRSELLRMNEGIDLNYTFCNNFFNWIGHNPVDGKMKYEINSNIFDKEAEIGSDIAFYAFQDPTFSHNDIHTIQSGLSNRFYYMRIEEAELISEILASGCGTWFPETAYNSFIQNVIMFSKDCYIQDYC